MTDRRVAPSRRPRPENYGGAVGDVRLATVEDRELLVRIAAEGFYADPVLSWIFPDDAGRLGRLLATFGQLVDDFGPERGTVHLADGACAAFWRDPTFEAVTTAASRNDAAEGAADGATVLDEGERERMAILGAAMERRHPHEPHWYLNVISTLPSRQGQGLGAAVLQPVLERADASGVPCYLESTNPRNRTLYHRHGFEDGDEIPLDGGPAMLAMWRAPLG
jgi:GNAT superfamily N-acetyltransferase